MNKMEDDKRQTVKQKKPEITISLIANRNIVDKSSLSADQIADNLLKLSHIRLDREKLSCIDNLDCLGPVTNLYLQHNEIEGIKNLDALPNLRFLMLAENRIERIENLQHLQSLVFLDLSDNLIEDFNPDELPKRLMILNLVGNPCITLNNYRCKVLQSLSNLKQLDGEAVTKEDRKESGCQVSESESEEEEDAVEATEENEPIEAQSEENFHISEQEVLNRHCNDILVRAKIRSIKEDANHKKRLDELAELRTDAINTARHARECEEMAKLAYLQAKQQMEEARQKIK